MEFSYKLTEVEYTRASKLRFKGTRKRPNAKAVVLWVLILVGIMMLWSLVTRQAQQIGGNASTPVATSSGDAAAGKAPQVTSTPLALLFNVGPFLILVAVWFSVAIVWLPKRLRRMYQRDPAAQGLFTVNVTPQLFTLQNTAGISSQISWNIYECWIDGGDLILLVNYSQASLTLSLAGLTESQRMELRGILQSVLPRK